MTRGLGLDQRFIKRFGNENRIGLITTLQAGKRAVAGAFFLHHRLEIEISRRGKTFRAKSIKGKQIGHQPRFHVTCAATIHPVAFHSGREGGRVPHIQRTSRDNIDMTVEDQGTAR